MNLDTPGQNARLTFSGTAGQRAFLDLGNNTIGTTSNCPKVTLSDPAGTSLAAPSVCNDSSFIDMQSLPATGVYTVVVDPASSNTGSLALALYQKPPDVISTLTPDGSAVVITTFAPNQDARLRFSGTAGQRISLWLYYTTIPTSTVSIDTPLGTSLASTTVVQDGGGFIDTQTLPVTGTYTVVVDPAGSSVGNMTLILYEVPPDDTETAHFLVTGPVADRGVYAEVTATTPGQNAQVYFDGVIGQRVGVWLYIVEPALSTVAVYNPNGTLLAGPLTVDPTGGFLATPLFPAIGTYTIKINPQGTSTGSVTILLIPVLPDLTAPIIINGPAQPVVLTPGQDASLLFPALPGQQVTVRITDSLIENDLVIKDCVTVTLVGSDGTSLTSSSSCDDQFDLPAQTLATAGVYTIHIDPIGIAPGRMNVQITSP